MLGIWPLSLCFGLLCCQNVPGRERQTLNTALLPMSQNEHLNRERFTTRSSQDPLSSCFHPRLFQHHHHRRSSCLERTLVMDSTSTGGCASRVVVPQYPSRALHFAASLSQNAPEMRPPCSNSPAAGEARIWVSVRGRQISLSGPTGGRSWGHLKTGLPCLWKGQQIPALSRWDLSHTVKKTVALWHMSEAAGKINVASLLWPHCLFTHRDLLASFSICQHLLTTPEQGHHMADAPRRRRHLVTQQQLCSSSRGGSRLLHLFPRRCDPAYCSASSIYRRAATFGNFPCP